MTTNRMIEICIHCYKYQRRLCWMLSSILQQKGLINRLIINISHTDNDGSPTTKEVCDYFRLKGLNIKETILTMKEVSNRAIGRNKQVKESTADYMLFCDGDMVFDEWFFDDLNTKLDNELKDIDIVMGADRYSLKDQFCIDYFDNDTNIYPTVINEVTKICSTMPVKYIGGKDTVAGYFQLCKLSSINGIGKGCYVGRSRDKWRRTVGDRAFRIRMGGRYGIKGTKPMYHLNHSREGDIQR